MVMSHDANDHGGATIRASGTDNVITPGLVAVCSRSVSRHPVLRDRLAALGAPLRLNDAGRRLAGDELQRFLSGARQAIVGLETIDEQLLAACPDLQHVSKVGVGTDNLDFDALERHGVSVHVRPGVNRRSVAELAIAMAISLLRHVGVADRAIRSGAFPRLIGRELSACTLGVLGCGNVGKEVVRLLSGWGVTLLAHDIVDFRAFYARHDVEAVSLQELLARSDVLTLHLPLDASTRGLIDAAALSAMKPQSVLVQTSRGGIVDEGALVEALETGHLLGAGLDVFAAEPPAGSPLLASDKVLLTSHLGGSTEEAVLAMGHAAIDGLR